MPELEPARLAGYTRTCSAAVRRSESLPRLPLTLAVWHWLYCRWWEADRAGRRRRAVVWGWLADSMVRVGDRVGWDRRAAAEREQAAREHAALEQAFRALAFRYGGTRPDQYDEPEDRVGCEAMYAAGRALGKAGC